MHPTPILATFSNVSGRICIRKNRFASTTVSFSYIWYNFDPCPSVLGLSRCGSFNDVKILKNV